MDKQAIPKRLRKAEKEIQQAISYLSHEVEENEKSDIVATCLYCGEPIKASEPMTRGIHKNTCYNRAWKEVEKGTFTWEGLIKSGKILSLGETKAGRKKEDPLSKQDRRAIQANSKGLET